MKTITTIGWRYDKICAIGMSKLMSMLGFLNGLVVGYQVEKKFEIIIY
jgi:hypothetical protein